MGQSSADSIKARRGRIVPILCVLALSVSFVRDPGTAAAQTWTGSVSNLYNNANNWTGGVPNSSTANVTISNTTLNPVVISGINPTIGTLTLGSSSNGLTVSAGLSLTMDGSAGSTISNAGGILVNGGILLLDTSTTLSGTGTLTLSTAGGTPELNSGATGVTLTNVSNTIQGAGDIAGTGVNLALVNQAGGTVNANVAGGTLILNNSGEGITNETNAGLLEATGGGTLRIGGDTTVNNFGGNITANSGSTVQLDGTQLTGTTTIQGGTLNNIGGTLGTSIGTTAALDGSTSAGAVTINGTYTNANNSFTYMLGTINNTGNVQVNASGGFNSTLSANANTTLQGGGTVTLSTTGAGEAFITNSVSGGGTSTMTNVNNTIQGNGYIGFSGLALVNQSGGTIDANVSGSNLTLGSASASPLSVTNTGLLEATSGGVLNIGGATISNAGGNITAGSGSTVQLSSPNAVTSIQGGNLNNNGGTLGTSGGGVSLDGSTSAGAVTINGTYTAGINGVFSTTTNLLGTINNTGNILVNQTNILGVDSTNVTLQGGGTVTLSSGSSGNANINAQTTGLTLTNVNNTIQGTGDIAGTGVNLAFVNQAGGTVNANANGGTLILNNSGEGITNETNAGLLEATGGGTLRIGGDTTVNNGGGNITASSGSTVQLFGAQLTGTTTIQGGTLNNNGGTLGTATGTTAALDGSTSAGAVTINGTYTNANNSFTYLLGTINNTGNVQVSATGGFNSTLSANANTTLQGGGTVTLSTTGAGEAFITNSVSGGGTTTLTNVNNTIQGNGFIGFIGLALVNQTGGTIDANVSGSNLTLGSILGASPLSVTNTGLLEATSGGVLNIGGATISNAGGNITAGSGSTVQLNSPNAVTTIQGGSLNNNGGTLGTSGGSVSLDGSTSAGAVTINGTYTVGVNGVFSTTTNLLGTINNAGNIQVNQTNILGVDSTNVMVQGGGTVTLSSGSSGNASINGALSGSSTLTNVNNTIQGAGTIGNGFALALVNQVGGTILANVSGQTLQLAGSGGGSVTNNGTFQVNQGSTLQVGGSFTTAGTVNIGALHDTSASLFQMVGTTSYVQTAGTTSLWSAHSTLGASTANIEGGLLQGFGTVGGNLINSGSVQPGDGPGILSVTGNYTQNTGSILDIAIGGRTSGSQYSVLAVSGSASLTGTLDVSLVNGFSPVVADTFVVLTSDNLSGTFADNTIRLGSVTFDVEYSPTGFKNDVVLLVTQVSSVPEPASLLMLAIGLAATGAYVAHRPGKPARA